MIILILKSKQKIILENQIVIPLKDIINVVKYYEQMLKPLLENLFGDWTFTRHQSITILIICLL